MERTTQRISLLAVSILFLSLVVALDLLTILLSIVPSTAFLDFIYFFSVDLGFLLFHTAVLLLVIYIARKI